MKTIIHIDRSQHNLDIVPQFGPFICDVESGLAQYLIVNGVEAEVYFASSYIGIETEGDGKKLVDLIKGLGFN